MIHPKKVDSNTFQIFGRTIGRNDILARLWELANLSPEVTKGIVTGQLKALELLLEVLAPMPVEPAAPKPNVYRASWLAETPNGRPS